MRYDDIREFPRFHAADWVEASYDMSLRDYFAAKAMQAIVSRNNEHNFDNGAGFDERPQLAEEAYGIADAMLKERAK